MGQHPPGGYINRFGYFVIGTTVGGNAIVIGDTDARVLFANHAWYTEEEISFEEIQNDGKWRDLPMSRENVMRRNPDAIGLIKSDGVIALELCRNSSESQSRRLGKKLSKPTDSFVPGSCRWW